MSKIALLIEDQNPYMYQALINAYNGFEFIIVERGNLVFSKYQEVNPAIILMDVRLPFKTGIDAVKQIREVDLVVPIIVMTAYGDQDTREKAMAAGANAFYVKPFRWGDMHRKMVELVNKSESVGPDEGYMEGRKRLIKTKTRRLLGLQEKRAYYGVAECPISILMEIEDLQKELDQLKMGVTNE